MISHGCSGRGCVAASGRRRNSSGGSNLEVHEHEGHGGGRARDVQVDEAALHHSVGDPGALEPRVVGPGPPGVGGGLVAGSEAGSEARALAREGKALAGVGVEGAHSHEARVAGAAHVEAQAVLQGQVCRPHRGGRSWQCEEPRQRARGRRSGGGFGRPLGCLPVRPVALRPLPRVTRPSAIPAARA